MQMEAGKALPNFSLKVILLSVYFNQDQTKRKIKFVTLRRRKCSPAPTIFFLFMNCILLFHKQSGAQDKIPPFIFPESARWADSVILTLTREQRIGQLFMVATWSNRDSNHV